MGTAKCREDTAGFEEFERSQMDFFVTAQRIGHGGPIAGKGGRVEDDAVKSRNDFLVRFDGGLGFEPVEHVHSLKRAFVGKTVRLGVSFGCGDGISALVQAMDVGSARAGGVQSEPAKKAETIESLSVGREMRDGLVIDLLVQVHPGFMAFAQIGFEFQAVQVDRAFALELARQDSIGFLKPFEFSGCRVAALDNGPGRENLLQGCNDLRFVPVHAQRRNLNDQNVFIFVDNQSTHEIAFGIDDAERGGIGQMAPADFQGGADARFEEGLIDLDAFGCQDPDVYFRFGIENSHTQETLAMVFYLDEVAVGCRFGEALDFAGIDPGMARNDAVSLSRL